MNYVSQKASVMKMKILFTQKKVSFMSTKKPLNKLEVLKWFLQESNQGHMDFQSIALPTELRNHYIFV